MLEDNTFEKSWDDATCSYKVCKILLGLLRHPARDIQFIDTKQGDPQPMSTALAETIMKWSQIPVVRCEVVFVSAWCVVRDVFNMLVIAYACIILYHYHSAYFTIPLTNLYNLIVGKLIHQLWEHEKCFCGSVVKLHHVGILTLALWGEAIARGAHSTSVLALSGASLAAIDDAGAANASFHILGVFLSRASGLVLMPELELDKFGEKYGWVWGPLVFPVGDMAHHEIAPFQFGSLKSWWYVHAELQVLVPCDSQLSMPWEWPQHIRSCNPPHLLGRLHR